MMTEKVVILTSKDPDRTPHDKTILREKSLAIYFEDSRFRRNKTFNFIVSKLYFDKRLRVR